MEETFENHLKDKMLKGIKLVFSAKKTTKTVEVTLCQAFYGKLLREHTNRFVSILPIFIEILLHLM